MKKIRGFVKIALLLLHTFVTYGVYFIGLMPVKLVRARYEPWRNLFMRTWSRGVAAIFNMKLETVGVAPKAPFFLVSNHLSYLDIIPLYLNLRCTFVAKQAVRKWPLLGAMIDSVGVIFVDRSKRSDVHRVNELLSQSMNKYQGLVLFPEGTSSGGQEVLPFHSSLLKFPADKNIPVQTVSLSYKTKEGDLPARDSVCFFGGRDGFLEHVFKLAQTRKVWCKIRFGEKQVQSTDRKELAANLHKGVQEIFEPTSA